MYDEERWVVEGGEVQKAQWSPGPSVSAFFLLLDEHAVQTQQNLYYTMIFSVFFLLAASIWIFVFVCSFIIWENIYQMIILCQEL